MSDIEQYIIDYAQRLPAFTSSDIAAAIPEAMLQSKATLEWHLSHLTRDGKLGRIGKGRYTSVLKARFIPGDADTDKGLSDFLKEAYPDAIFCIYKGTIFSTLQHHLAYNTLTYVETQRELTEAVFHRFQEEGRRVFHRPDKKTFYDYVDIAQPGLIIKPLVSGSPVQESNGVTVPMLEKLLVDIRCDADFDYMAGGESFRMLDNALSLFTINRTKLLRYAGRRHRREEFERDFNQLGL